MVRRVTGGVAALLLVLAGFFVWKSRAAAEDPIPQAPTARMAASVYTPTGEGFGGKRAFRPPEISERSKEEKRFARADRDKDGRIILAELLEPRRKAFAKLDTDGSGQLSFEEWTGRTSGKFSEADADRSGWLTAAEFATTKPKTRPKPARCACS